MLAYTVGHAGALLPTPGGVGGTDGGLIGMFVVYGTPLGLATAAVLGYRVFQLGLPVVLGAAQPPAHPPAAGGRGPSRGDRHGVRRVAALVPRFRNHDT